MTKKIILLILALVVVSCSKWSRDKENFVDTYKDINIVRIKYQDSAEANIHVAQVLKNHNYTKESFRQDYFKYAQEPKQFLEMLDSAKNRAEREAFSFNKSKYKTRE